jgi:hypothetical protein
LGSANYYALGDGKQWFGSPAYRIGLAQLTPQPHELRMPVTGLPARGGQGPCGYVEKAVSFLESGPGQGITGIGFLGSFRAPAGGVPLTYSPNQNFWEAFFFHENQCYAGHREYGFFLAGNNSSIWAYWGTNENQANVSQAVLPLNAANNSLGETTIQPNTDYYFEMYPTASEAGCGFAISVFDAGHRGLFHANPAVGPEILRSDPDFCGAIASDNGYITANIEADPEVAGRLPESGVQLHLARVFASHRRKWF